ncbi:hypothetical protein H2198_005629 [Neophaeococcomyces mojaviensis]|uniref:Uncharacterized protein n=1 Tax=Neophaeococcomyces mojaviensis TaxID=3383035 RepID=A0ACC3A5G1_9EURO|nr:hypothetical protein H2198_005629 [Knufia sp. JES_112]
MQKRPTRNLPLAALLIAAVNAQNPTVTSYFPVCPTASSTTITLPTTVTFCPGPHCNGGGSGPVITPPPMNGVGMPGVHIGEFTSVGTDGKTTVLGIYETVYDSMCSTGLVPATYTVTAPCPCEEPPHPTLMPEGFETKVVPCHVCAATGGPSTVTLTQPCPTGPYATQTPTVNQIPAGALAAPGAPAPAAQASAGAGAGASASSGPGGSSADAGVGAGAQAQAGSGGAYALAGAGAGASAQAGPGGSASANAGAGAGASAQGPVSPAGISPQGAGVVNVVPLNGTMPKNGTNPTIPAPGPVQSYVSSAGKASLVGFPIFAVVFAALLL